MMMWPYLAFGLTVVTLTFKILSGSYLRNFNVKAVFCLMGHSLRSVRVLSHGVTFSPWLCQSMFTCHI